MAEGRTAAALTHPNIVSIYAADVWNGRPAIVMELIRGETLRKVLDGGRLDPHQARYLLDQLLDAVQYAHEHGVIHRDIKPDKVFVTSEGLVKLADFGIARVNSPEMTMGTTAGMVLGTPGYMSPEQAKGAPVDTRSDIFSVGVVAYEMFAGYNPFVLATPSDTLAILYRVVNENPAPLSEAIANGLPVDPRPAIMAALSKDPDRRPQTAAEFKALLNAEPRRAKAWIPLAIVGLVAAVSLGVLFISSLSGVQGGGAAGGASAALVEGTDDAEESDPKTDETDATEQQSQSEDDSAADETAGTEERDEPEDDDSLDAAVLLENATASMAYEGHTYALFEFNANWNTARTACEDLGGHLVTVSSADGQEALTGLLQEGTRNSYWLGGHVDGDHEWMWVNGEPFVYSNWAEGAPDNWGPDGPIEDGSVVEECVGVYRVQNPKAEVHETGTWNDLKSDGTCYGEEFFGPDNVGYICEWDSELT